MMKRTLTVIVLVWAALTLAQDAAAMADAGLSCVPQPQHAELKGGYWRLQPGTAICCTDARASEVAQFFADKLSCSTGWDIAVAGKGSIVLEIDRKGKLPEEAYRLSVTPQVVRVLASTPKGLFRGMTTFLQLLPPEVESGHAVKGMN